MAPKGNRLKKEKKEKTSEQGSESSFISNLTERLSFHKNDKFVRISGLLLLLFSVFMFISFASYFFTWQTDHDKVAGSWWELFSQTEIQVDNWLGKFGAVLSHLMIESWFGISAFVFVLISFLSGFRILFGVSLMPMSKTLKYSFFAFFFVAATLGYVLNNQGNFLFLAGNFGYEINRWLRSILGSAGAGIFILFSAVTFVVTVFNVRFRLPNMFSREDNTNEDSLLDQPVVATNGSFEDQINVGEEQETPSNSAKQTEEESPEEDTEEEFELELDTPKEIKDEKGKDEEKNLDLEIVEEAETVESGVPLAIETTNLDNNESESPEAFSAEVLGEYDPTLDLSSYKFPELELLEAYGGKTQLNRDELKAELENNKNRIVETLGHYNIAIDKIKATVGPTVTLFEIIPQAGIRISKIKNLEDDIALSLAALGIRIIAPIPGKGTIGIEVPNQNPEIVSMRSVIASDKFQNSDYDLPIGLGKTISNEVFVADLAKMPHLLMAGATGQGKSVGLNAVLASLLYKKHPSQVKFVLVDPKKVELTLFKTIERHFLAKLPGEEDAIITDTRKVINTLNSLCIEMDQRYELLKDAQVRNIREYNAKFVNRKLNPNNGHRFLPFIVLVVDEFADLIMTAGKEIETPIARLAQLARAIGIHLIIATQRPSVNIITGTIKANFPARLAFRVSSKVDSRTILDTGGAEQLIGRGDMLLSQGADIIRLQCAFVDTPEIEKITDFIGNQRGYGEAFQLPEYVGDNESGSSEYDPTDRDPLFEDAARMIVQHQQGSASLLQRRLKLGYNRAGRLIDQLEAAGIIGPFEGSKAREVKIKDPTSLEQFLNVDNKE